MSTLTRNDGAQFVMQAYRELLTQQKKTPLIQQISQLSQQHGQFVRLFKHRSGQYDAVFSAEPGFLLGESVKHYFGQLDSLVFCEVLPETQQVLVVVVREGSVYLDTMVPASRLYQELLPLMSGEQAFHIFTSGALPLQAIERDGCFAFPSHLVRSFEHLDEPLFPRLPALRALELLPLPLALKAEHLSQKPSRIRIAALTIILGILGWSLLPSSEHTNTTQQTAQAQPYSAYYAALSTPAPEKQLDELAESLYALYSMPGWHVEHIRFRNKQYTISATSHGGTLKLLKDWVAEQHWHYSITPKAVILSRHSLVENRPKPRTLYANNEVLTILIDRLHSLFQDRSIQLKRTTQRGKTKENELVITIKDGSPEILMLIGSSLKGLPITLSSIDMSSNTDSFNGTLYLSAWGG